MNKTNSLQPLPNFQKDVQQLFNNQNNLYDYQMYINDNITKVVNNIAKKVEYLYNEKLSKANRKQQEIQKAKRLEEQANVQTGPYDYGGWRAGGGKHQKFGKHSDKLKVKKNEEITRNPKPIKSKANKKNSDKVQSTKQV